MDINPVLTRLRPGAGSEGLGKPKKLQDNDGDDKTFAGMVREAVHSVDEAQKVADQKVEDVIMGRSDNVHEVMIAMEKAQLSFQLMVEIRNKAIETYQELSRMQI